ncbi:FAD-binding domain-containing protein [Cucurbitaria berberidis CBS 394.84]|uniref:FAD-binding domain-containing protein n=1 Tax=Cucurbitaria berberidis CBS 394.84 TaxID=1168544 RepID=A0A9P4G9M7_9PLEO|nr:FAD-binding domain-containing protein [Cucurbitaria berberidis CBS 394.84]KAF1841239.1 FAD-binding domain-containing protein [Cucurbitaria berberidis CBS 394.84]
MSSHIVSLLFATTILLVSVQSRTLFPYEEHQLTREHVASLPEEDAALLAFEGQFEIQAVNTTDKRCRYDPSDKKWPSEKAWNKLRRQLSAPEILITTTPQASLCYGNTKNDAGCQQLARNWSNSYTHIDDPTEVLSPIYQGLTCQPPSIYDIGNCTLGGYPARVIKAKTVSDIQCGINFARNDYMRLVVKNTGHDFAGKSAGYGALSIWTHGLKDIQFFEDYVDEPGYRGPAIKAGAGVQAFELYKFANERGVIAVAGEGQTVGVFGGYILGGGHSPLSSLYGMAADHVLGFEVVTPIGEFLTANSTSNADLFWALKGGGGGTFGVVSSVTIKAYKDMPVTAASWQLDSSKIGKDKFWAATKAFFDQAISNVDNGTYSYWLLLPTGPDFIFIMQPFFAPNKTANQLNTILGPYFSKLTSLNIPISPKITEYKSFYPAWQAEFPLEPMSGVSGAVSSRLFPRSNFASETGRNITFNVLRQSVEAGQSLIAFNMATRGSNPDNSVNPAWRTSVYHIITGISVSYKASNTDIMSARAALTNGTMQKWRDVTPGSGAYLNEADRLEPNWQQSFWGDKYARLLEIKREMDHRDVFWAHHAVGSEGWKVESFDGLPNENGKLCKVGA